MGAGGAGEGGESPSAAMAQRRALSCTETARDRGWLLAGSFRGSGRAGEGRQPAGQIEDGARGGEPAGEIRARGGEPAGEIEGREAASRRGKSRVEALDVPFSSPKSRLCCACRCR
jgi:hypothetical protein